MRCVGGCALVSLVLFVGVTAALVRYLGWGIGRVAAVMEKMAGAICDEVKRFLVDEPAGASVEQAA